MKQINNNQKEAIWERWQVDLLKGIFIILIVLGHSPIITSQVAGLQRALYTFHVQAFLILPFLFPAMSWSMCNVINRGVRYMVPYLLWVVLCAILAVLLGVRDSDGWLLDLLAASSLGTAPSLKVSTGFQLYWFLPALFFLTITRSLLAGVTKVFIGGWMMLCIVLLCYIGEYKELYGMWQVWSCLSVMALWPICLVTALVHKKMMCLSPHWSIFSGAIGLGVSWLLISQSGAYVNIAVLSFVTLNDPIAFIGQFMAPIGAFILVVGLSRTMRRNKVIEFLGNHSLIIYLSHSLVFYALYKVSLKLSGKGVDKLSSGVALFVLVLLISSVLAIVIAKFTISRVLCTPRSLDDLRTLAHKRPSRKRREVGQ